MKNKDIQGSLEQRSSPGHLHSEPLTHTFRQILDFYIVDQIVYFMSAYLYLISMFSIYFGILYYFYSPNIPEKKNVWLQNDIRLFLVLTERNQKRRVHSPPAPARLPQCGGSGLADWPESSAGSAGWSSPCGSSLRLPHLEKHRITCKTRHQGLLLQINQV